MAQPLMFMIMIMIMIIIIIIMINHLSSNLRYQEMLLGKPFNISV
jgi:hypothetical protein